MTNLTPTQIKETIKTEVTNLGFLLNGFTTPELLEGFPNYKAWINAGYHGEMEYLARSSAMEKRQDPTSLVSEVKSILVLGIPYPLPTAVSLSENLYWGKIASYAQGPDYHDLIREKLSNFSEWLDDLMGNHRHIRIFTDTAPIMEKELGMRAGLGWIGRNGLLINPDYGSFFFLTEIFLDIELPPDLAFGKDLCGKCHQCVEKCPTNCILDNRTLDSTRCLSYLTIEKKGGFSEEDSTAITDSVFGCDVCQIVCPWNQKRLKFDTCQTLFRPNEQLKGFATKDLLLLDDATFQEKFKATPISRTKRIGIIRNLLASIGNIGHADDIHILEKFISSEENENLRIFAANAQVKLLKRLEKNAPNSPVLE